MTDTETITENTTSHLYTRRGWELENISSRVVGIVWVNYRKKWGWSGWKSRWIELHKDYLLFYKYSKRKRHYKQINIDFTRPDAIYKTGGMECDGEMFSFSVFKEDSALSISGLALRATVWFRITDLFKTINLSNSDKLFTDSVSN